jgi:hypothetical protein
MAKPFGPIHFVRQLPIAMLMANAEEIANDDEFDNRFSNPGVKRFGTR